MAFMSRAAHVLQWRVQRDAKLARAEQIPKSAPQFGLQAATRLHEAGIASNRRSAYAAVNVFLSLVHTARQATKAGASEVVARTARTQAPKMNSVIGTKS